MSAERDAAELRRAITAYVCNVSNLPEPLQVPALGLNMSSLIDGLAAALAPLLAERVRAAKAEAAREVADAIAASTRLGFELRPDGTEDPTAAVYLEGLRDAHQIARDRAASYPCVIEERETA